MDYEKRKHILDDLVRMCKGHGLTIICGNTDQIGELTKEVDGIQFFITDGEKLVDKRERGITITKNRFKPDENKFV